MMSCNFDCSSTPLSKQSTHDHSDDIQSSTQHDGAGGYRINTSTPPNIQHKNNKQLTNGTIKDIAPIHHGEYEDHNIDGSNPSNNISTNNSVHNDTNGNKLHSIIKSSAVCKFYLVNKCNYGDECKFQHRESSNAATPTPTPYQNNTNHNIINTASHKSPTVTLHYTPPINHHHVIDLPQHNSLSHHTLPSYTYQHNTSSSIDLPYSSLSSALSSPQYNVPTLATLRNSNKKFRPRDICRYWHKGTCRYGGQCSFLHPIELDPALHHRPYNMMPITNNTAMHVPVQSSPNNTNARVGRLLIQDNTFSFNSVLITEKHNVHMIESTPLLQVNQHGHMFIIECRLNTSNQMNFHTLLQVDRMCAISMIRNIISLLQQYSGVYEYELQLIEQYNSFYIQVSFGHTSSVVPHDICKSCNIDAQKQFIIATTSMNCITLQATPQVTLNVAPLQHIDRLSNLTDEQLYAILHDVVSGWTNNNITHILKIYQSAVTTASTHIAVSTQLDMDSANTLISNFTDIQQLLWHRLVNVEQLSSETISINTNLSNTCSYIPLSAFTTVSNDNAIDQSIIG